MNFKLAKILFLLSFLGCSSAFKDTFNSRELISSRGEKIYINSLNWGITDDNQISLITSNRKRPRERTDTIGAVFGLDPFVYSFENDTLKLYFESRIKYTVKEKFETIALQYMVLDGKAFAKVKRRSYDHDGYYSVPMRKKVNYPSNMPKPPSN